MKPTLPSLREGGWVLVAAAVLIAVVLAWALAPAILRTIDRPPGDGADVTTFAFDLTDIRLPGAAVIEVAMAHRDLVPVLDDPTILQPAEIERANNGRAKYLVSNDLVIGIEVDGHPRAYPLSVLNVHEIVNDQLGDLPVAVSWHWPSATTAVFDRRLDGRDARLGASGLVGGGNLLLYARRGDGQAGEEPLFSQVLGRSVTGPVVELKPIPHDLTRWTDWLERHPNTTVIAPVAGMKQRYKKGKPDAWFASSNLLFSTPVPTSGPPPKSPVLIVHGPGPDNVHVLGVDALVMAAGEIQDRAGRVEIDLGRDRLAFETTARPPTARLVDPPAGWRADRSMWVTANTLYPDVPLWEQADARP